MTAQAHGSGQNQPGPISRAVAGGAASGASAARVGADVGACARSAQCSARLRRRFLRDRLFGAETADLFAEFADGGGGACVAVHQYPAGTLSHWGHAQIDGLLPFAAAHVRGLFDTCARSEFKIGRFMNE